MLQGGAKINDQTITVIRYAGLIVPSFLTLYAGVLLYIKPSALPPGSLNLLMILLSAWMLFALYQFLRTKISAREIAVRLVIYHIFAAVYVLLVTGFASPFLAMWVLLFIAAYAGYGRSGLYLSASTLVATAVIDSCWHTGSPDIVLSNTLTVLVITSVGVVAVIVNRIRQASEAELSRSKAQEMLERDRILTLVNNLADAILSTDKNGVVRVYNAASLNLLDTNTSLNGQHINDILPLLDNDKTPVNVFDDLKKSQSVIVRDDLLLDIEGETLRLEVTYSPIRSSYTQGKRAAAQDGYILILRDITKSKSLEEERDEFISVVSHELRTPITIAEGTISNVQVMMDRTGISPDVLRKSVDTAHEQVIFLAKMVNDLSTLSRAERGVADSAEEIDIRQLVTELYAEYAPQAEKKDLHFNLDAGAHLGKVAASRLYLQELLQNFITNSIKYTKEGSVTLEVTNQSGSVTFTVKDTGIGISKTDQAKIFNKFYRSEDYRTRETGGTGLGLYVATKLAKKLNTDIALHSRLNHGSSFSFTLPTISK
jgi:PAS domain S-box-containing protein